MLILSIVFCLTLVRPIYVKLTNNPTYTSVNSTNFPVWQLPFPGVTICSNLIVSERRLYEELKTEKSQDGHNVVTQCNLKRITYFRWQKIRVDLNWDNDTFVALVEYAVFNILRLYRYEAEENTFGEMNDEDAEFIDHIKDDLPDLMEKVKSRGKKIMQQIYCLACFRLAMTAVRCC